MSKKNLIPIYLLASLFIFAPAHFVKAADTRAPIVAKFVVPATVSTKSFAQVVVPVTTFEVINDSQNVGTIFYKITETPTKPLASAYGWTTAKPTSYTFRPPEGILYATYFAKPKTLYAWSKDTTGNISNTLSDTVQVRLLTSM